MSQWRVGTIGLSYKEWVGPFYPAGSTQREFLPYYSKVFNAVEMDTTFHSIPRSSIVESWYSSTPPDFIFCVKTPRVITHELRLENTQAMMNEFIESILPLREKLGPVLIQLPPSYTQEYISGLRTFLELLPSDYQFAIEFRHHSWFNDKTAHLLSEHDICWVAIDFPNLPQKIIPTTDYLYIRWIGINNKYHHHSYEREEKTGQLQRWLEQIQSYLDELPVVYGFFNNDYTGFAAGTCKRFMQLAGLVKSNNDIPYQEKLF